MSSSQVAGIQLWLYGELRSQVCREGREPGLASASRDMWDLGQIAFQAKATNPAQQAGESSE